MTRRQGNTAGSQGLQMHWYVFFYLHFNIFKWLLMINIQINYDRAQQQQGNDQSNQWQGNHSNSRDTHASQRVQPPPNNDGRGLRRVCVSSQGNMTATRELEMLWYAFSTFILFLKWLLMINIQINHDGAQQQQGNDPGTRISTGTATTQQRRKELETHLCLEPLVRLNQPTTSTYHDSTCTSRRVATSPPHHNVGMGSKYDREWGWLGVSFIK
jgi:hypothetical protein